MSQSFQKGKETFESGFYCAESVLKVIAEEEGIDSPLVPAIATGFCSGTARTGFLCGAVAGGILSMGLVFGRSSPDQSENQTYRAVRQLLSEFGNEFGSTNCYDLIQCDLATEEGQKKFRRENLRLKCGEMTGKATAITRRIIEQVRNT